MGAGRHQPHAAQLAVIGPQFPAGNGGQHQDDPTGHKAHGDDGGVLAEVLPVQPQGSHAAAGEHRVDKEGALIQEIDQDQHRGHGGQHHQDPHARVGKLVGNRGHNPQEENHPGEDDGQTALLPGAPGQHDPDDPQHGEGKAHKAVHLEDMRQNHGDADAQTGCGEINIKTLDQQDDYLRHHSAQQPEQHPVKYRVLRTAALVASLLIGHSHHSFFISYGANAPHPATLHRYAAQETGAPVSLPRSGSGTVRHSPGTASRQPPAGKACYSIAESASFCNQNINETHLKICMFSSFLHIFLPQGLPASPRRDIITAS